MFVFLLNSMRRRPFPEEEDLASIDEEALKAKEEAEYRDEDEEEEWIGEIELSKSFEHSHNFNLFKIETGIAFCG